MEKKIPYISRNYDDYKAALIDLSKKYYPEMSFNFDDASVGAWFIDMNASIADELSYHIDRAYQETNIDSARKASTLFTMARNMGFKVPGPKGAMCEVAFRCVLPVSDDQPLWDYAPIIKKGTKVSSGSQTFELMEELNFAKQFSEDGVSNRLIQPIRDTNNVIVGYNITKFSVVVAGETNIYKKYVSASDITPFMEILLPAENVMNVESIIVKEGSAFQSNPTMGEFYMPEETANTTTAIRFFEVQSLSQQERWDAVHDANGQAEVYDVTDISGNVISSVTKGEWKTVKHKFITEYTDKGYLKITFGAGVESDDSNYISSASTFARYQISKMMQNDSLGILPKKDSTIFILYRAGGGKASNLPKGAINTVSYLNAVMPVTATSSAIAGQVRSSITVESVMPSVSGKDMPSADELKNMIKYSVAAQERCVTLKDYVNRVMQMPAKYGCPFRVGAMEANNKVMLYLLGINSSGQLDTSLPLILVDNIQKYLSKYRMINDYVEIKPGGIINLAFDTQVIIDKDYNPSEVITNITDTISNYMDVNKHEMGEDIYVGDIAKEISKVDGVINLVKLDVCNIHNINGYSNTQIQQALKQQDCNGDITTNVNEDYVDLEASDGILYSSGDCMFEVKNPKRDITMRIKYKQR